MGKGWARFFPFVPISLILWGLSEVANGFKIRFWVTRVWVRFPPPAFGKIAIIGDKGRHFSRF